ncbi:MAG TPA: FAD-linked oxidase C-terminal domain-containing protein, partial [Anaerolineales bacterium]
MAGSEGTLALIHQAELRLVDRSPHSVLLLLSFDSVAQACDFTPGLLETEPAAIELIPRTLLAQARTVPAYARRMGFMQGDPTAVLVVEYNGMSVDEARSKAGDWAGHGRLLEEPQAQADLWAVRKAGLGLLMALPGEAKPITFIEDMTVPVERLGEYVRRVDRILAEHDTIGEWYAHASAGCLHLRPLINLKSDQGVRRMRSIADAVAELVFAMRGSISGEHGDGLSHTEYNARLFGSRLYQDFKDIKQFFDPQNLLNPGKVVVLDEMQAPALDTQLRYGGDFQLQSITTPIHFVEGNIAAAADACSGVGICRKHEGVMCPSFQATHDERHSTRGRANALRAAFSGQLSLQSLTSRDTYEVLDLCLECKGCKSECPSSVDMARIKAAFLDHYHQAHGVPLRSRLFANLATLSRLAMPLAPLINLIGRWPVMRAVLEKSVGISRRRSLPRFERRSLRADLPALETPDDLSDGVVLFLDTHTEFSQPQIGRATYDLLTS